MSSTVRVASPPARPVMVFDGDCRFCTLWIRRWQRATGDRIEYLAFQDPRVAAQFPEIPREQFEAAVQFIDVDGAVCGAAEAVFRSRAVNPGSQWPLGWYLRSSAFAGFSEWCYRFVARHRKLFSFLTWLLWGNRVEAPSFVLVRWIFLRAVGIIYLIAFLSLGSQIIGLVGREGIAPAEAFMQQARQRVNAADIGPDRFRLLPTLCWFNASDSFLDFQCLAGSALAVFVILGVAPVPCLFLLWLIYLSLMTVGDVFLSYQWDVLLLETGFIAIFFAPLQLLPRRPSREAPPSRIVLWLLRWLLFRLMFESGCVKLLSGDPTWHQLTALNFHYETQPLPTWIGWYAHQLPPWFQQFSTGILFGIEIVIPFLIFAPRRPRQIAFLALVTLQALILLTGNYCFFNLLTIALCLSLLDDAGLETCGQWLQAIRRRALARWHRRPPAGLEAACASASSAAEPRLRRWHPAVTLPLAGLFLCASTVQFMDMFSGYRHGPERFKTVPAPLLDFYRWLAPLRTFNSYGLFRVMTTNRLEIVVEGSDDGATWKAYAFKYKPADVKQRPGFVEPHQPRLDWQMWFAALGSYRGNPWFVNFCVRLLQGSPPVLALLKHNPFPDSPPRYLRALSYEYHFTDSATRRATGEWWRRELKGLYLPVISLNAGGN